MWRIGSAGTMRCRGAILFGIVLCGCGRIGFEEVQDGDGFGMDTAPVVPWRTPPKKLVELDSGSEEDPTLTADRLTIVWGSYRSGGAGNEDLWTATRATPSSPFTGITNIAILNSAGDEAEPEISADGKTLYYEVNSNIFVSTNPGSGWSAPTLVSELSTGSEDDLGLSPDGLIIVIIRNHHFMRATRASTALPFGTPVALPELDDSVDVASPTVGDGGRVIYFHNKLPRDLYVARLVGASYSPPTPVVELNTIDRDADPCISGDETSIIYNCVDSLCETTRP